ncbi:MAG: hypothetical protein A2821_02360 [Candidatus Magasanikbacteria bacterium RIFCSPHIGHO2_01_FULL_41_23]|uniref:Uncharacterized protein n=1 Tax=Candidatus Magasanikbacteria bacterium RIFCSPLOWO2_01_FULL_40_15 TaxID=1798686 RepID=A0A1F6N2K5_9BACT|nr:MAG: hypothetical protein A2821_02360 [Candidatus Magasanikbacteria bacterium RIFCSPHIGHO2_01_FULL_41_23]OGH66856.1 MAG: hypothetical protein A3C66_02145 [Candidatus Magasanikbacteria bacterium RIFCSPHIGHO2_02_FULL_41_35]OGH74839.1 MAG: hypothetical protein A3F22_04070 [Candidatus Magasanikbacteria bacterium RIFCSPHIGHO2_12_FULL_41_16]OGH78114.1 MAG: hypothetical protein A2983_03495 [Candidatus Magasanikbacteria bacterium RIFCSPLOWO2_01_FULL_40_15]
MEQITATLQCNLDTRKNKIPNRSGLYFRFRHAISPYILLWKLWPSMRDIKKGRIYHLSSLKDLDN